MLAYASNKLESISTRAQIEEADTALQDNDTLEGHHLSLQFGNMRDIAIFANRKVFPYIYGFLKRDLKVP